MNSTRNVLDMTKAFITQQLLQDSEIPKADQIDLLNRSVNYFKENTEYDRGSFAREMFQNEEVAGSFERFAISDEAVKKLARVFKSVLKLDKVFHICIHGDRNMIERGEDECGRKVYKIYYDQELQSRQKDLYSVPSAARACAIRSLSRSGS